jgi:N,N-dimethylformamidase
MRDWAPGRPYLLGYSERLSVEPGDTVDVRVSTQVHSYTADLVRLRHGDENPAGPGFIQSRVEEVSPLTLPGRVQSTPVGSLLRVPPSPVLDLDPFSVSLWFQPTLLGPEQHLMSWLDTSGSGFELVLRGDGLLEARSVSSGQTSTITAGPLQRDVWHLVGITVHRAVASVRLSAWSKPRSPTSPRRFDRAESDFVTEWEAGAGAIVIGGQDRPQPRTAAETTQLGTTFGRVADPAIYSTPLDDDFLEGFWEGKRPDSAGAGLVAFWDLGREAGSDLGRDAGPHRLHATLVNAPTRWVTGPHFGDSAAPPGPATHCAVHLHADDVADAGWLTDFEMRLPDSLTAGVYAVRLVSTDGIEDHVPLFVRTRREEQRIAVLFPAYTYLAYGNERMNFGTIELPDAERADRLQPVDRFIAANPWLGGSLYDEHQDRSGVTRVSRHRPMVTMRPEHRSWLSGDPRHLSADLYLVDWLEHHGYHYDVLTDEDLHREGARALAAYQVILTGSHPEYVTGRMLDAVDEYVSGGGRLMYLGGNGFYWVTSSPPDQADVIEVRRGYAGSRTWESLPGDEYHSSTSVKGGLWRHRGRSPNQLVGVGFAASGWGGSGGAYRVVQPVPARAAFVFGGVDVDQPIGDFGLIMNGCVGDEVDRWDPALGSPAEAIRLATCEDLNDSYVIVVEDTIGTGLDITSTNNPRVRADMVLMPTDNGGAVFSVGSMAWVGALSHNGYDNNVSVVTKNVLERFLSRAPI